jgi:hypothetical protein
MLHRRPRPRRPSQRRAHRQRRPPQPGRHHLRPERPRRLDVKGQFVDSEWLSLPIDAAFEKLLQKSPRLRELRDAAILARQGQKTGFEKRTLGNIWLRHIEPKPVDRKFDPNDVILRLLRELKAIIGPEADTDDPLLRSSEALHVATVRLFQLAGYDKIQGR